MANIRLKGGPGHGQGFTEADFRMRIIAAFRMGRRTPGGPGWALGYRPSDNETEWVWADGAVCHSPDQVDAELLRPYGAHLHAAEDAELSEAS